LSFVIRGPHAAMTRARVVKRVQAAIRCTIGAGCEAGDAAARGICEIFHKRSGDRVDDAAPHVDSSAVQPLLHGSPNDSFSDGPRKLEKAAGQPGKRRSFDPSSRSTPGQRDARQADSRLSSNHLLESLSTKR
jgi:hypothetical protein